MSIEKNLCKKCGELRILNKKGICIFCSHQIVRGTEIKSKTGYIDENKYLKI